MRFRADAGDTPEFVEFMRARPFRALPNTLTGKAWLTGEVVYIPDVLAQDEIYFGRTAALGSFRTALCVPIMREGEALGVFSVSHPEVDGFSTSQIELTKSFADQAGIAIENARQFNETREALERQTATADILKVIARSPSDTQPVFDAIAASAKRLLGGHTGVVGSYIDDVVHLVAFTPVSPEADAQLRAEYPRRSSIARGE